MQNFSEHFLSLHALCHSIKLKIVDYCIFYYTFQFITYRHFINPLNRLDQPQFTFGHIAVSVWNLDQFQYCLFWIEIQLLYLQLISTHRVLVFHGSSFKSLMAKSRSQPSMRSEWTVSSLVNHQPQLIFSSRAWEYFGIYGHSSNRQSSNIKASDFQSLIQNRSNW